AWLWLWLRRRTFPLRQENAMEGSVTRVQRLQHAIAHTSDGYFHLRTVLILGLANAADAIEILAIGYILAVYEDKEGSLTRAQQSVLAAAIFAGMFVGGLFFGFLSDAVGRRKSLLHSLLINAVFALLSSFSPNIYVLIGCRTLAGVGEHELGADGLSANVLSSDRRVDDVLGIGGTIPAMFTLCSEHVPVHRRGFYVTIVASYWMVGSVFTAALAWFMLGSSDPSANYSWRTFAAIVSLPAFVCWVLTYRFVPESAQYFARRRQFSDAEDVVNHIRFTNGSSTDSDADRLLSPHAQSCKPSPVDLAPCEPDRSVAESLQLLFDPMLRATTVSLLLSWFCLSFGSYGLATWITVLFKRINLSDPFANAFIYAAANLPGNLLSAFLMDRVGGRAILLGSMMLSAICAAGFAAVSSSTSTSVWPAVGIVLLSSGFNAFSTSGWNAIDLMSAESYPTDLRTTGMGFLAASGRAGSVVAQFVNGYLVGPPVHVTLLLAITASMMLLGSISAFFVRDYRGRAMPNSVNEMRREAAEKRSKKAILGLANAADGVEILAIGYILAVYDDEVTRTAPSLLAASIFVGMIIGGLVFGPLGDTIGRRRSLLLTLLVNGGFALASAVAPNVYVSSIVSLTTDDRTARIGGTIPTIFTLCAEHASVHRRGFLVAIVASFWMVGSVFTAAAAWLMLGREDPSTRFSWRSFCVVVALPSFACWLCTYLFVPESACFHVRRGERTQADAVQRYIQRVDDRGPFCWWEHVPSSSVGNPADPRQPPARSSSPSPLLSDTLRSLCRPPLRNTTLALFVASFCLSFGSYGLSTWITVLFKGINLANPFANAFIYAAASLPGSIISALYMDRVGGRVLLALSLALAAGCAAGFACVSSSPSPVAIVLLASGFNTCSMAAWNGIDLLSAEAFPTRMRATAMGVLAMGGRSGSVLTQFVNGFLVGPPAHIALLLSITATTMLVGAASAAAMRDRHGRELAGSIDEYTDEDTEAEIMSYGTVQATA
ncbi:TPA: hypothetical protein N0F65_001759, partial [Lagenidium giganteum]